MSNGNNIDKLYKKRVKPLKGEEDALYFIGSPQSDFIDLYVTDKQGNLFPVINKDRVLDVSQLVQKTGWIQITNNTYTEQNPYIVESNVKTKLPIFSNNILNPFGYEGSANAVSSLNKFIPEEVGDIYFLRLRFRIDVVLNNQTAILEVDIGGNQNIIWDKSYSLVRSKSGFVPFTEQVMLYSLDTFLQNGADINLTIEGGAEIYDITTLIYKAA